MYYRFPNKCVCNFLAAEVFRVPLQHSQPRLHPGSTPAELLLPQHGKQDTSSSRGCMHGQKKKCTSSISKTLARGKVLKCRKAEERGQILPANSKSHFPPPWQATGASDCSGWGQAHGAGRSLHQQAIRPIASQQSEHPQIPLNP